MRREGAMKNLKLVFEKEGGWGSSIIYITLKCKVRPVGGVPQQPAASPDSWPAQRACRRVCRGSAWVKVRAYLIFVHFGTPPPVVTVVTNISYGSE